MAVVWYGLVSVSKAVTLDLAVERVALIRMDSKMRWMRVVKFPATTTTVMVAVVVYSSVMGEY